ncbi:hypothetical protein FOA52_006494 [Chlamydomonas sp. UWO 241]|nr:hypothetical protein FOA52_006494 [Chlamydomonas sp. UWO 241]
MGMHHAGGGRGMHHAGGGHGMHHVGGGGMHHAGGGGGGRDMHHGGGGGGLHYGGGGGGGPGGALPSGPPAAMGGAGTGPMSARRPSSGWGLAPSKGGWGGPADASAMCSGGLSGGGGDGSSASGASGRGSGSGGSGAGACCGSGGHGHERPSFRLGKIPRRFSLSNLTPGGEPGAGGGARGGGPASSGGVTMAAAPPDSVRRPLFAQPLFSSAFSAHGGALPPRALGLAGAGGGGSGGGAPGDGGCASSSSNSDGCGHVVSPLLFAGFAPPPGLHSTGMRTQEGRTGTGAAPTPCTNTSLPFAFAPTLMSAPRPQFGGGGGGGEATAGGGGAPTPGWRMAGAAALPGCAPATRPTPVAATEACDAGTVDTSKRRRLFESADRRTDDGKRLCLHGAGAAAGTSGLLASSRLAAWSAAAGACALPRAALADIGNNVSVSAAGSACGATPVGDPCCPMSVSMASLCGRGTAETAASGGSHGRRTRPLSAVESLGPRPPLRVLFPDAPSDAAPATAGACMHMTPRETTSAAAGAIETCMTSLSVPSGGGAVAEESQVQQQLGAGATVGNVRAALQAAVAVLNPAVYGSLATAAPLSTRPRRKLDLQLDQAVLSPPNVALVAAVADE